ncbi:hypothetical protein HHK36_025650 [Tetracentron sinense]|uniref:3-hydroxyacyl-CoA dehydrogenase n=1 Tax=Tetracentron sinense TaxID=13715 RepID=A0A835D3R8_TETSI|nr:hypothetical protein HHK36_025650 [Tetracentron sinense]
MANMRVLMEVGSDGVAVITFCNPPVNALAPSLIAGLKEKYKCAMKRDDVKAIVLTGEGGKFSGGFDISVFQNLHITGDISLLPDVSVDLLINTIEDAKKPSVAAIQGLALGGGLELAMGCHARVASPKTQLGLPELTLGVIPGFGGTQRLPRLVGMPTAVEMLLSSKSILSEDGKKLGLIDAVVSSEELLKVSRLWALDIAERRRPWITSLRRTDKLGSLSEVRGILKVARQQARQTAPNMPQHQACLDVIEEGVVSGGYSGVLKETEVSNELVLSSTARGLVHVFFAQRATSKVPRVTDVGLKPRQTKNVAVIGGGLMGSGIATALLLSNISVFLMEINSEYLQQGVKKIEVNLQSLLTRGKLTQDKAEKALSILKGVLDYSEFKHVDMVIEMDTRRKLFDECFSILQAVIENISLKQSIFSELEKACPPHCILATNTSTIDLNIVGEKTSSQDRIVGAHFFSSPILKDGDAGAGNGVHQVRQPKPREEKGSQRDPRSKSDICELGLAEENLKIAGGGRSMDWCLLGSVAEMVDLGRATGGVVAAVTGTGYVGAGDDGGATGFLLFSQQKKGKEGIGKSGERRDGGKPNGIGPAHVMPLLEIVQTRKTSAQVILDLITVGKTLKKVPVVVGNCTGFAVNRTFFPYMQGAHLLANLGVDVFRIDRVISTFGMPMGPFQLQDLSGYGIALATGKEFATAFLDRTFVSPLIDLLVKSGRSGKNNGKGFYIYEKGSKPKPDASVLPIIEESRGLINIMPGGKPVSVSDQEILEMILFPVVNEACRVMDEGVVVRASDLDIASVLGMSFPSYR